MTVAFQTMKSRKNPSCPTTPASPQMNILRSHLTQAQIVENVSTKSTVYSISPSCTFFAHLPCPSISSHFPHFRPICSPCVHTKATCLPVSTHPPHFLHSGSTVSPILFRQACRFPFPVLHCTYSCLVVVFVVVVGQEVGIKGL